MSSGYESFLGLVERPFSLTTDAKYFFKSRSHGRALETLTFGLRSREQFLLVTGDVGVGKTVLCRTFVDQLRRRGLAAFVANPLLTTGGFLRLLLEDFGVTPSEEALHRLASDAGPDELLSRLVDFLEAGRDQRDGVAIVIDEAHTMPASLVEQLVSLSSLESDGVQLLQFVLVGQPAPAEPQSLGIRALDERVVTKARLLPLGRDECAAYVAHRLTIAGGSTVSFTQRAIDLLYGLSGGVPRLVNLLCERALQEAAAGGAQKIEPAAVSAAAATLQLLRARPRRFRWFPKRVS